VDQLCFNKFLQGSNAGALIVDGLEEGMEDEKVYRNLAKHLDNLPGGFPATESGVELRILRRLFSPEEAALATHLTLIPEEARVIGRRAKRPASETAARLDQMARKGLIFNIVPKKGPALYTAAQFVIGIWEYHVNDLDPELIRDMNEYIPALVAPWEKSPQLRTIPVGRSIAAEMNILSYETAEALISEQKHFLVAPCICRREHRIVGKGCDKPEESCLVFGWGVDYYRRNGIGRVITKEETLEILKRADEAGLVLQPSNARKIVNICCCCGCCCQVLKNVKRHPEPASLVSSPFVVTHNAETCVNCENCIPRCQMDALYLEGEKVLLKRERCIGCGLCVSTCPTQSLTLARKPASEQPSVPGNIVEASLNLARSRGKLGAVDLARMQLKSKLDRLLSSSRSLNSEP
jgi:Na+-translocating ferredoxin:NAD+ oxidoreductase subunit B